MESIRKFDRGLARFEAWLIFAVFIALVGVASAQVVIRNLSFTGADWAAELLLSFDWGDEFMERATLWVAMLGASLAAHDRKHIAIDIVPRLVGPKARAWLYGIAGVFTGVTGVFFSYASLGAIQAKSSRIVGDYGVLDEMGDVVHVCVGTAQALADAGLERPAIFCSMRSAFAGLGIHVNSAMRMLDLVVPALFFFIGLRFFARGVIAFTQVTQGGMPLGGDSLEDEAGTQSGAWDLADVNEDDGSRAAAEAEANSDSDSDSDSGSDEKEQV